ncbi:hypothetical protein [Shewanella surugensis]|uniref:Uncharacterized protein n=1 Tax=Shewanella surugensis TaxID=212020 RepID=A0ABT0LFE7_9GAMM|nr:hypothetical protein [Shewanella surugensis]MCL1126419.1 hypothetical protein [Shewanella surugensis]
MLNLTKILMTTKKFVMTLVLLMAVLIPAHADPRIVSDLTRNIENNIAMQMQEAVDSLKSDLSLSIQFQIAEMLFQQQLSSILSDDEQIDVDNGTRVVDEREDK